MAYHRRRDLAHHFYKLPHDFPRFLHESEHLYKKLDFLLRRIRYAIVATA